MFAAQLGHQPVDAVGEFNRPDGLVPPRKRCSEDGHDRIA